MEDGPEIAVPTGGPPGDIGLDFCVIGAQKSGTTTLFEHLRTHPGLVLPAAKEAPWFNRTELVAQGTDAFLRTFFPGLDRDAVRARGLRVGTVTPHYMSEPGVASVLAAAFPALRAVAILREPIERAHSHFRMATRRGLESRSFATSVACALEPEQLVEARAARELFGTYVAWSEYGRVLGDYLDHFDREQLLVVYTEDLARDPQAVLGAVCAHIGVAPHHPADLWRREHQGGSRRRFPALPGRLARSPLGSLYRRLPEATRARLFMRFDHWNVRREAAEPDGGLPSDLRAALRAHFAADQHELEVRHGLRLRWCDSAPG